MSGLKPTPISADEIEARIARQMGLAVEKKERSRVKFEWHAVEDHAYYNEHGIKRFTDVIYIRAGSPTSKTQTHRLATERDRASFPVEWQRFVEQDGDKATDGFPLVEWHGCTRAQSQTLAQIGVKTVEALSELDDEQLIKFGQSYPDLKVAAINHIKVAAKTADLNKVMSESKKKDKIIDTLKGKVDVLEAEIVKLKEKGNGDTS